MAMAASAGEGQPLDGALLAAAALDHCQAGLTTQAAHGAGGTTPLAVAESLGRLVERG
jgi:hypothetical protein